MVKESPSDLPGFDAAAADFDALGVHVWGPIGQATVAATRPRAGERVLDACCGTGASAIPAAIAVGAEGMVDAVDSSVPMIAMLDRAAVQVPHVRGHAVDALTWESGDYDVVQAVLGIFFFPDMTAGTDHLIGLAKPGGRVGFTIWRKWAMEVPGRLLSRAIAGVTRTDPPEGKPHLINEIDDPDRYRSWLAERGLTDVDVIVDDRRLSVTDELAWLIVTGSGFRGALAELTPAQITAVREHYLASLADEGVTEIDATTLIGIGARPT